MANPWLGVPLADYEGHMKSASVRQLDALSDLFAEALAFSRPVSVAVLGIAGGNGLQHIDGSVTHRVTGFDINPSYLEAATHRYPNIEGLKLACLDLSKQDSPAQIAEYAPFQLVHAALVLEHAGVGRCLDNALSLVAPGGLLSVVLQLPSETEPGVGNGQFASIQNLSAIFTMIDPAWLASTLEARGFSLQHETRRALVSGKAFWMGIFARAC